MRTKVEDVVLLHVICPLLLLLLLLGKVRKGNFVDLWPEGIGLYLILQVWWWGPLHQPHPCWPLCSGVLASIILWMWPVVEHIRQCPFL